MAYYQSWETEQSTINGYLFPLPRNYYKNNKNSKDEHVSLNPIPRIFACLSESYS